MADSAEYKYHCLVQRTHLAKHQISRAASGEAWRRPMVASVVVGPMVLLLTLHGMTAALVMGAPSVQKVVITGGTHGNEYTGVHVLEKLVLRKDQLRRDYPSLDISTLLTNPRAHLNNCRFVDMDLNRMFTAKTLGDLSLSGYEPDRAKAIAAMLGPKGHDNAVDFCIDLHTTTAAMGCTMIVDEWCPLAVKIAAYISEQWSAACAADAAKEVCKSSAAAAKRHELRIMLHTGKSKADTPYLCSVARHGLQIEVGPTPQGLLRGDVIRTTERALRLALEYLEMMNKGHAPEPPPSVKVFVDRGKIAWDGGNPNSRLPGSIVHPSLQDRDYEPLKKGDALFEHMDGTIERYDGSLGEVVYPIFINEAAYYYAQSGTGIGMTECVDWLIQ